MIRFAPIELDKWLKNWNKKPMALRGAMQVGKTWLVCDLANLFHIHFFQYLYI